MADITLGTMYEARKAFLKTMAPDSEAKLNSDFANLGAWLSSYPDSRYYMLMCKERSDFTLFHLQDWNYSKVVQDIRDLLEERGTLISIEYVHGENCYQCWVRVQVSEEAEPEVFMYMLFEADWMVIETGR